MSVAGVRRDKAALSSGREPPATATNRVTLVVGRPLSLYPINGHARSRSACLKRASRPRAASRPIGNLAHNRNK
jgi:hypothetical protein